MFDVSKGRKAMEKHVVIVKKENGETAYVGIDGRLVASISEARKYTERSEATNYIRSIRNSQYLGARRIYVG